MNKFQNIFKPTRVLAIFILLLVGFFSLAMAKPVLAAPVCGIDNPGTCISGLPGPVEQIGNKWYWECKDNAGQVKNCSFIIQPICGDGYIDPLEQCDGTNLNGKTCKDFGGFDKPGCQLLCTPGCTYDATKCSQDICQTSCGDGVINGWEECEAGVKITKTCEEFGSSYFGGNRLICNDQCFFRATNCYSCGNGVIETYNGTTEVCDGSAFNIAQDKNGDGVVDCKDYGFKGGKLSCKRDYDESKNCKTIDASLCSSDEGKPLCGNGVIDKNCSGNAMLPCVDDAVCQLAKAGTCGSNEECDGTPFKYAFNSSKDVNRDGKMTCADFGATDTTKDNQALCGSNCLFSKTNCNLGQSGCKDATISPSVNIKDPGHKGRGDEAVTSKLCCGPAANTFRDYLSVTHPDLCLRGSTLGPDPYNTAIPFWRIDKQVLDPSDPFNSINFDKAILGWSWTCINAEGTETTCRAYKNPKCAVGVASKNQYCTATQIFKNEAAWLTARNNKVASGVHEFCESGLYSDDTSTRCLVGDPNWSLYNKAYFCSYTPLDQSMGEAKVRCSASWAPPSTCGKLNGYTFVAKKGSCSKDTEVATFMKLKSKAETAGYFCAPGNKVVINSKKFTDGYGWVGFDLRDYGAWISDWDREGIKGQLLFGWQCQSDDGYGRKGEIIDCQTRLDDKACSGEKPMCGPAVNEILAYQGPGPKLDFCAYSTLGGTPFFRDFKVTLVSEKRVVDAKTKKITITPATWSWKCLGWKGMGWEGKNYNGEVVDCSAKASVYCGKAENGAFAKAGDVRGTGACENGTAQIKDNLINASSDGKNWLWTCQSMIDPNITTNCKARVKNQCGYLDGQAYDQNTFISNANLLCASGSATDPQYVNADNAWYWKCGEAQCSALKLACGSGHYGKYFGTDFTNLSSTNPGFLCTNGKAAVRNSFYTQDSDKSGFVKMNDELGRKENVPGGFDPAVWWECEGGNLVDGGPRNVVKGCRSFLRQCGYLDSTRTKYGITEQAFEELKRNNKHPDAFCTNGSIRVDDPSKYLMPMDNSVKGPWSAWYCVAPGDEKKSLEELKGRYGYCYVAHPKCGDIVDKTSAVYYLQTVQAFGNTNKPGKDELCEIDGWYGVEGNVRLIDNGTDLTKYIDFNENDQYDLWNKCDQRAKDKTYWDLCEWKYFHNVPGEFFNDVSNYIHNWTEAKKSGTQKNVKPYAIKWLVMPGMGDITWDCGGAEQLTTLYGVNKGSNSLNCSVKRAGCNWAGFPKGGYWYDFWGKKVARTSDERHWITGYIDSLANWNKAMYGGDGSSRSSSGFDESEGLCLGGNKLSSFKADTAEKHGDHPQFMVPLINPYTHVNFIKTWFCEDSMGETGYFFCSSTWQQKYEPAFRDF